MMIKLTWCLMSLAVCAGANAQLPASMKYPITTKCDTVDNYFGTKVPDPYRWLENDRSAETVAWVKAQNEVTQAYLSKIPYREEMKVALTAMWNYPKTGLPEKIGQYYLVSKNSGLQNQAVLYLQDIKSGKETVFLDPNALSKDGTVALNSLTVSHDNRLAAYSLATGGSDWNEIRIKSLDGKDLSDVLKWVKFSGIAWYKNGFFYSCYNAPNEHALSQKNEFHKIYYHAVGTPQESDKLIYEDKTHANRNFAASVTEDERYLIISGSEGTGGNCVMVADLSKGIQAQLITIVAALDKDYAAIGNFGSELLFRTNALSSNYKVIKYDFSTAKFADVIPAGTDVLQNVAIVGGKIVTQRLHNAYSQLCMYSKEGRLEKHIALPEIGTVTGISGKQNDSELFYSFTSFTCPGKIFKLNVNNLQPKVYSTVKLPFKTDEFITDQVFFASKDGTKIPMFVVHKKGLKLDGLNPLLLYGYGGFNISVTPTFSVSRMIFLKNGGVLASVNLRGGGEFGEQWHNAGTKLQKQNVFDDFIAAAEYLIKEKYTCSDKLAIQGGSNGGLLVGACMTQRPELFKVAIPQVGVMDMLRYHKFTIGWAWVRDYGSSDNEEQFKYIYRYSPLHNIKSGVAYPATLVTTGDHDDRVVPAHSFKFMSTLQAKQSGTNPTLIRIETMAGHGAGKPTTKAIQEAVDMWSFMFFNLNMKFVNPLESTHK